MEPDARARIVVLVAATPGLSLQDLALAMGLSRTAVARHTRRLAKDGRIRRIRSGRRVLHVPNGHEGNPTILAAMRQRTARIVLESFRADPRLPVRELARRLDVTPKAVRWHVKRFRADGLLEGAGMERDGRRGRPDAGLGEGLEAMPVWDPAEHPEHG
ncbi:MAG: Winged helix-turn-helix DNA-binding [Thermoplasmata archaeon]|jgi:DNA-binding Lrp family transcriptional regulator|nr:Winged helix-turn-helix DNA-binding [Thermoplasmata archaeon]